MTTRDERLAEFTIIVEPPAAADLELLCEDHVGTYSLPFPCRRAEGAWRNARTGQVLEAEVLGWRRWD